MISRRHFTGMLLGGATAGLLGSHARAETTNKKTNIIFFLVDDMGWQDTSVPFHYSKGGTPQITRFNQRYTTPNMQRLANRGMLFTSAYAQPICSPTRVSLLTGMNSARHRVTNWTLAVNATNDQGVRNGTASPNWPVNGVQPPGTQPTGAATPPWQKPGDSRPFPIAYTMSKPYVCAKGLPQFLKEVGYYTVHCGKAHFGASEYMQGGACTPGADPKAFGFDVNIAGSEIGGPGDYRGDHKYGQTSKPGQPQWWVPGLDENNWYNFENNVFLTDALTEKSLRTLTEFRAKEPNRPFYLYLAHYAVHVPLSNDNAWDASRSAAENIAEDTQNPNPADGLPWNATERNYAVLLKGMDDSLGKVMDWLEAQGIADNTAILFTSDNGGLDSQGGLMSNANAPLKAGKGSCYEGGIREPMIVSWPGVTQPGSRCDTPVICEDFFPTILEIAGLDPSQLTGLSATSHFPASETWSDVTQVIDGKSFLPLLRGEEQNANRPLLFHSPNTWRGVNTKDYDLYTAMRSGKWKLIYHHDLQEFELFDLESDISENTNLFTTFPAKAAELAAVMGKLLRARNAQMPTYTAANIVGAEAGSTVPWPDEVKITIPPSITVNV